MDGSPGQEHGDLGLEVEGTPVTLDLPSLSLDSEVPKQHQQMSPAIKMALGDRRRATQRTWHPGEEEMMAF